MRASTPSTLPGLSGTGNLPDPGLSSEAELVRRARTDPDSFGQLYRLHHPAIARYIRRRVGDRDTADDLVADTFATALAKLGRYRDRGLPFRSWLYGLASNGIRRWLRRSVHRRHCGLEETAEPAHAGEAPAVDAAESARVALLSLPARYQTTLALHYLEGLSVLEVAGVMGCRPGTVKARLSRGRELLRARLEVQSAEVTS
ncbi:RNA polymerase sigma factor [Engelhardtia mirabilis]|uniref:RNA polymerase sigma factor YlaC n=1 Tax=Engelhardtia mirabilis TaxID=2528011 RepID=A0A518BID9_9BACT|nr:RNA polymerase sigma factor YlaC [Planctomycetes bacterium Pla133]QDV01067.1 RNA polymerase sigma factor YlaC [Planctomycetes bacterium Pla86]